MHRSINGDRLAAVLTTIFTEGVDTIRIVGYIGYIPNQATPQKKPP
jgi:hypothetical protein